MGPQRVLQALAVVVVGSTIGAGRVARAEPKKLHERVAVIDLGPDNSSITQRIRAAIVDAGLDLVIGDGVEDALAGRGGDTDSIALAAAIADAKTAFGALDCTRAVAATHVAIEISSQRQAAGLVVPELADAYAYALLCADRSGDIDNAMLAARGLRATGGSPAIPQAMLDKYPSVDAIGGQDRLNVEITAATAGATIWFDHVLVGPAPQKIVTSPGLHVVAAANGTARGAKEIQIDRTVTAIAIATPDVKGAWSDVAARVTAWHGKVPDTGELGWVMAHVKARAVLVRYGDTVEVWGRSGLAEAPYRLGAEDGVGLVGDVARLVAVIVDRVHAWTDRAPDPDKPLLLDTAKALEARKHEPTQWWVYVAAIAPVIGAAVFVYLHDSASDVQHVELHYPGMDK